MAENNESRIGYLFKNVGLLALSNLGSKLLIVLLVPLYTAVLTTDEYGTYDLISIVVEFLIPVLTLNAADGVMRFAMEKSGDKVKTVRFGLAMVSVGTLLTASIVLIENAPWEGILGPYVTYIPAMFVATALYSMMTQFSRGCERISDVAVAGIINTSILVILNLLCLLVLHLGLDGFFIANIFAQLLPGIWLIIRRRGYILGRNRADNDNTKIGELLAYALPLAFSTLGWLIVAVSDRFVVTYYCGIDANGLYSIAYKIPAILNVVQGILIQAWQLSAIKEYGTAESDGFFARAYRATEASIALFCSLLMPCIPLVASILFQQEFYSAWIYVPFLLIYVVFNASSGIWGGIFSAQKDAFSMASSMIAGAMVNVVLAVILVQGIGVQGAALATMISGFVIWGIRAARIGEHTAANFQIKKSILTYSVLLMQAIVMVCQPSSTLNLSLQVIGIVAICIISRRDLVDTLKVLSGMLRSIRGKQ